MNDAPHTGADRIPPGQYATDKWPVLTYGRTPQIDPEKWTLKISGLVAAERTLSWQDFQALPRVRVTADFHCVTRFSTLDNGWEGIATREVLRQVEVDPEASHVHAPLLRRLHHQPAAGGLPLRAGPLRGPPQRQAAADRPRRPGAADRAPPLRLEERQVGERRRAPRRGPPRLLGGERLPHLRRPLERGALQLARRPARPTRCGGGPRSWGSCRGSSGGACLELQHGLAGAHTAPADCNTEPSSCGTAISDRNNRPVDCDMPPSGAHGAPVDCHMPLSGAHTAPADCHPRLTGGARQPTVGALRNEVAVSRHPPAVVQEGPACVAMASEAVYRDHQRSHDRRPR